MTLATLVWDWPWLAGSIAYVVCGIALLVRVRQANARNLVTYLAQQETTQFAPGSTLGQIAVQFMHAACAQMLVATVIVGCAARLVVGHCNYWDLAAIAGLIAIWPVQEWLVHVFVLHIKPFRVFGRQCDPIVARFHRDHHRHPWDPRVGLTPTFIIVGYLLVLPPLAYFTLPLAQGLTALVTFFALVLNYEWTHYLIHTSYAPKGRYYKRLWKNHRLHHFKNENYWYGVTMLSGDALLHTQPAAQETPRSPSCLNIAGDEEAETLVQLDEGRHEPQPTASR